MGVDLMSMRGIQRRPAARLLGYAETGTPEWFAMREGRMTGSRIAAALGLSPWVSPFTLYFIMTGLVSEQADTPALEWGRRMEKVVVQKYVDEHPEVHVRRRPTVWQNLERPWQVVSPDALIVSPGVGSYRRPADAILEVKTGAYDDHWGAAGTDQVPIWVRCQILWMLDTLGLRWCYVPVKFGHCDYREYVVEVDDADVDILRRAAVDFLGKVERRERPDIDGSDATYEMIKSFHPDINGKTVELPDDLIKALAVAQEQAQEAQEELQTVRCSIAEWMGHAKVARAPSPDGKQEGRKVADRRSKNGGTPYVQLCDVTPPKTLSEMKEAS